MSFFLSQCFFTNKRVYLFYKSHENNANKAVVGVLLDFEGHQLEQVLPFVS